MQRELAKQTFEIVSFFVKALEEAGYPGLRGCLCIGGTSVREQLDVVRRWAPVAGHCRGTVLVGDRDRKRIGASWQHVCSCVSRITVLCYLSYD